MIKRIALTIALLLLPASAFAQCNGLFQPGNVCGNNGADPRPPTQVPIASIAGLPSVSNNTQLKALSVFNGKVAVRNGFDAAGDSPATVYVYSTTSCTISAGAGDNGSQVKPAAASGCWIANFNGPADIRVWGVKLSGADATTQLQLALNTGKALYVPSGTVNINGTLTTPVPSTTINGEGFSSKLNSTSTTAAMFNIQSDDIVFNGVSFDASVVKTAGAFISIGNANQFKITNFTMYNWWKAIEIVGPPISGPTISNGRIVYPSTTNSIGVDYSGAFGAVFSVVENVLCSGASPSLQPLTCFRLRNIGDLTIKGLATLYAGNAITIDPGANQRVQALLIEGSFIDSGSGNGINITPSSNGLVDLVRITDTWIASNVIGVFMSTSAPAAVREVDITASSVVGNSSHGVLVNTSAVSSVNVADTTIAGNGGYGFITGANVTGFTLKDNIIGSTGQFLANTSGGVALGANNNGFMITDNFVLAQTSPIMTIPTPGPLATIKNNLGYTFPGGGSAPVCASPCVLNAGPTGATFFLNQSATNTATVAIGAGSFVLYDPNYTFTLVMNPNETAVVTWTTTAPTYTRLNN